MDTTQATDLAQYRKQADNILEIAKGKLAIARRQVAMYVDIENANFKPGRMPHIGNQFLDIDIAIKEIEKRVNELNQSPWSNGIAMRIYTKVLDANGEIEHCINWINSLTK